MTRLHDRSHFFKYFTADTLKLVLESRQLKWSSPALFNDPFDHQTSLVFNFTEDEFIAEFVRVLKEIVFGTPPPDFVCESQIGRLYSGLRSQPESKREGILNLISEATKEAAQGLNRYREQINETLIQQMTHSRVFCVTETYDNVVMWSHYGDEHKGAVLKLNCIDEIDDNLLAAKPVQYVEEFSSFASVENWVGHLTGTYALDYADLFWETAYLKHIDWSYEREWRVHIPLMPHEEPGDGTSLYTKDKTCFGGVYFGCRMPYEDKAKLLEICESELPEVPIFEMIKSKDSFKLECEQIR